LTALLVDKDPHKPSNRQSEKGAEGPARIAGLLHSAQRAQNHAIVDHSIACTPFCAQALYQTLDSGNKYRFAFSQIADENIAISVRVRKPTANGKDHLVKISGRVFTVG